jgi:hypothetical protein
MLLPVGSQGQRPSAQSYTDVAGMLRFSTTQNNLEFFDGTQWRVPAANITVIQEQLFTSSTGPSPVNGTNATFTLGNVSTTAGTIVSINGVVQIPYYSYSISTTSGTSTLTFAEAPQPGDMIDVRTLTTTSTVVSIQDYTTGNNSIIAQAGIGIEFFTGNTNSYLQYTINPNGAMVTNSPNVAVSGTSATSIDVFATTQYSSAKYLITATNTSTGARQLSEVFVVTDGATSANIATTTNLTMPSSANWVTFTAAYSTGNVTLSATSTASSTTYRIKRDYQAI